MTKDNMTAVFQVWTGRAYRSMIGQILVQCITFLACLGLLKSVIIKPALGLLPLDETQFRLVQGLVTLVAMLAIYVTMVRLLERRRVDELAPGHLPRAAAEGFLLGAGAISLTMAVLWALGHFRITGLNPEVAIFNTVLWVFVLAAAEELVFRGILFRLVQLRKGTLWAFGVSGLLFGMLHITNEQADMVTVLSAMSGGLLMCSLYAQSGRLWLPIFFHASWNLGQVFYGTTVSGETILGKIYLSETTGPAWLTGGVQGPENSMLSIGIVLLLLVWSYRQISRKQMMSKAAKAAAA